MLFTALELLPVWTDELFTLETVARPVAEIPSIVAKDIHPPLYYVLLHFWGGAVGGGIGGLRSFSAVWALLATFLLDWFWARDLTPFARWLTVSLFAFSPSLLLYGRMARSYSMQVALAMLAVGLLLRWTREPKSYAIVGSALAAVVALLYTHYAPGVAVMAGFVLLGGLLLGGARVGAFCVGVGLAYLPWVFALREAVGKWGGASGFASHYAVTGNPALEHGVKLGFTAVSLTIGETFPGVSLLLVPLCLILIVLGLWGAHFSRSLRTMLLVAAGVGYVGVSRWVSYPFVPARLLWLLPFLMLALALGVQRVPRRWLGTGVVTLLFMSYAASLLFYYRRENFLNMGYAAPLRELAAILNSRAGSEDLILIDAYNTDARVLAWQLSAPASHVVMDAEGLPEARQRMRSAPKVWVVRNTRDISPGLTTTRTEAEACSGRRVEESLFEPYAQWQKMAMQTAGMTPLTHFYLLKVCTK